MGAQVVLHGQLIGVRVVTNGTAVFTCFVRVPVVDQTSGVAVCASALVAGERPPIACLLTLDQGLRLSLLHFGLRLLSAPLRRL